MVKNFISKNFDGLEPKTCLVKKAFIGLSIYAKEIIEQKVAR